MHCCKEMKDHLERDEIALKFNKRHRQYGILYLDGTSSHQSISFCPWCGKKLPESLADKWFDEIEALGYSVGDPNIPEKYQTDEWYREEDL